MLISGLGALSLWGCTSKHHGEQQPQGELGLGQVKMPKKPSVVDPLVALAKPSKARQGGPEVSKDGTVVPTHAPPAKELLNLHAVTSYDEVWVYAEPNFHAEKLGFLRRGVRLKVTREQGNQGCRKGWFQLAGGGFACASKGLVVHQQAPFLKDAPESLQRPTSTLSWARVISPKTPMWWRLPTQREWETAQFMRRDWGYKMLPYSDGEHSKHPNIKTKRVGIVLSAQGPGMDLPLSPAMPWLESGSFISLDEPVQHGARRYWKTVQGGFVQDDALADFQVQNYRGQLLATPADFDKVAFVHRKAVYSNHRTKHGHWARGEKIAGGSALRIQETQTFQGMEWSRISESEWVPSKVLIRPRKAVRPVSIAPEERWIDVDLQTQSLVAYQGDDPVYVTKIASGRPNTETDDLETPTGVWRIYSKEKSSDMVEGSSKDDTSFYQDVPWVMYFSGHLALRGSFWHKDFGHTRTAGSIDMGPSDARWLFSWTRPHVPTNWHGVVQSRFNPGTAVSIRGKAPLSSVRGR